MMILIADSGSTKTDWCAVNNGMICAHIKTAGMNPFFQTKDEMARLLKEHLLPALKQDRPEKVYFYGAGCIPEKVPVVKEVLETVLGTSAEVESDLLGAARALCGHEAGIACILGTGSNSCFYDGRKIISNIPSLGYILGDEGGGADLGKRLVKAYLRGELPAACADAFLNQSGLTREDILDKVYRQPFPNRFLASLTPFISARLDGDDGAYLSRIVQAGLLGFFRNCVEKYDYKTYKVNLTGSIAWFFSDAVKSAACSEGITLGKICRSPMEGLIGFHAEK